MRQRRLEMLAALRVLLLSVMAVAAAPLAWAGEAADYTRQALEAGTLDAADQELAKRLQADSPDDEARFGHAMVRFVKAIETFGQHHYRYGLIPKLPVPFLRIPVPPNPNPEMLTYEAQRSAFRRLLDDLTEVERTLDSVGSKDVKIAIDLSKVRLNLTGGASGTGSTTLVQLIASLLPGNPTSPEATAEPPFEVAFDRADIPWLQGYCHLLSAGIEFILAHDWRDSFERAAGLFYPSLRLPDAVSSGELDRNLWGEAGSIADTIAMAHEARWQPIHPERLLKVRKHLKQVVALSRQSWQFILAETDDDREWIPAPAQINAAMPTMKIGQEQVNAWLWALTDFDAVLDGRKLIPHWRFEKGVNLRMVLEEPRVFDAVLWASGHAAIPYLQDGPVLSSQTWQAWEQVFGGNFLVFAVYLN
jgi:hypothetical protein